MKKATLRTLPQIVEVDDYHEFEEYARIFRLITTGVKVKEIGFTGSYLGIAYSGKLTDARNRKLQAKIRERVRQYDVGD